RVHEEVRVLGHVGGGLETELDRLAGQRRRQRRLEPRPARRGHVVVEGGDRRVHRRGGVGGVDVHRVGVRDRRFLRLDQVIEAQRDGGGSRGDGDRLRQVIIRVRV